MIARMVESAVPVDSKQALQLAVARLRECAAKCPDCRGLSEILTPYLAYTLTDDERLLASHYARRRQDVARRFGGRVEHTHRGLGVLRTPCAACAPILATIKTCEAAAL